MLSSRLLWFISGTLFGLGTMLFAQQWTHPVRKLIVKQVEQNAIPSIADDTAASILQFGHPGPISDDLKRDAYIANYNRRDRNANWVGEHLNRQTLTAGEGVDRSRSSFRQDPAIPPMFQALLKDYFRSGFDRGHQAPAADATFTQEAMDETFFLTNMAPQVGVGFNRGYWAYVEEFVRDLVDSYPDVWVWTGELFLPQKGEDGKFYVKYQMIGNPPNVAVPTHFYKVVLAKRNETYSTASFVFPNQPIANNITLETFKVAQEAIERASGLMFLTSLPPAALKDLCVEIKCAVKTQHS
ncbi:hypothetical protein BC943DRAFT_363563 [Umbelopsis sp. AD052]|nr:hypothetical protein BC943DRAFT_363563 [Umbelopsis sp. AD052]